MRTPLSQCIALEAWPAGDRAAWNAAQVESVFGEIGGGGASSWRPCSLRCTERRYGQWLYWLEQKDAFDAKASPGARATVARVKQYQAELVGLGYAEHTVAGRLRAIGDAVRVMDPRLDTPVINRVARRLKARAKRAAPLAPRMRPTKDISALGRALMNEAAVKEKCDWRAAIRFRDGLLIALWAVRPVRVSNLAGIGIGQNLIKGGDAWRVNYGEGEMKAKNHFDWNWPEALLDDLETYLAVYRPILTERAAVRPASNCVWLSFRGKPMSASTVANVIRERTEQHFGVVISVHMIRHITATEIAEERPGSMTDVAAILAHTSMATSEKYYNRAGPYRAVQAFEAMWKARRAADGG